MADNKRDIELRIAATTSGSDAISRLAQDLDALAKEGGDAAPKFKELADALRQVGTQGDALQQLDRLEQQVQATTNTIFDATVKTQSLGTALEEQRARTQAAAAAQRTAKSEYDATRERLVQVENALRTLNNQYDRAGKATLGYKDQAAPLKAELVTLRNALGEQRIELQKTNSAYSEQASALRKVESEYKKTSSASTSLERSLSEQNVALQTAQQSLQKLGIESTDAATAIGKVEASLNGVLGEVQATEGAYERLQAITEAVARSNERNAQIAKNAAAEREAAARRQAAAEAAAASAAEAAALRSKLAQQQLEGQLRETEAAQKSLNDAFATTGVRSAQAIESEIRQIVASLAALRSNANVSGAEFERAFKSAETRVEALKRELAGLPPVMQQTSGIAGILRQSFSQLTAAFGAFELGRGFIVANTQLETLQRSLTLVTGSAENADRAIEQLRDVANTAGISVGAIANSFVKFRTSLDGANVPLETTESLFRAVVNASGQLGLSSERTSLILDALAQTANKGVVSMEELRQQLGDSLPGALDLTAKGLGISTAELVKLTESGRLLTADFLPALRNALVKTYGDGTKQVEGFAASWARLKNSLSETSQFLGQEGGILAGLTTVLTQASIAVRGLSGAFEFLGRTVGITAGFLRNFDLTSPIKSIQEYKRQVSEAYTEIETRLQKANGTFQESADAQDAATSAGNALADSQGRVADATGGATDAAIAASSGWAQLSVQYGNLRTEIESQISVSEKLAAAKKIESEARIAIVEISGDEAAVLRETAAAAAQESDALELVAERRQAEVDLLIQQRDELAALAATLGDPGGQRAKEVEAINQSIAARTAETEKARQAADASRLDAEAKAVALQVYNDNSAALEALGAAYDTARASLAAMQQAQQAGLATSEQVAAAQLRLSQAEALYRDAVGDSVAALDRKVRAAQGSLTVTEAQINLERERINTEIASAKATGDSAGVLSSTIALKELDIKLIEAKIAALRIEAQALRDQAAAELAALEATDPLLAQKRAEIELRLQNAKAKELEAQRNGELIRQINLEIEALRNRGVQSSNVANGYVNDREREVAANDKVRASVEELAAAERRRRNVDANGFSTDANGNTINALGPTYTSIYNQLKSRGLSDQQARSVTEEFVDGSGKVTYFNNPGQKKYGGPNSTLEYAVDRASEQFLRNGTAGQTAPASGGSRTVNVNINGQSYGSVATASQSDADKLTGIFAAIGAAANRSGP